MPEQLNDADLNDADLTGTPSRDSAPERMPATRLDAALADRGLVRSRTVAAKLITDGLVTVNGVPSVKPSTKVSVDAVLEVAATDHYVSRGAHKLNAALDAFNLSVTGRTVLDAGASTGGFSQVLLERGAAEVIAADVGHGQLAAQLKNEPRLTLLEGYNIRYATPDTLAWESGITTRPDLVVADLSFISLTTVLPALVATAAEGADFVLLIKPQFEVGRGGIREGIVHDKGLRSDSVANVLWAGWDLGLKTRGVIASPIIGAAGNHEYLCWMSATAGTNPTEWMDRIETVVGA